MSYDLMVFRTDAAPKSKSEFMQWFQKQTEWTEEHGYDDPANTSTELNSWFLEMIQTFPAMNGPYAIDDIESSDVADYSIGINVIYIAFQWPVAKKAYKTVSQLALKYNVGFFDASGKNGDIVFNGIGDLNNNPKSAQKKPWWKFW